MTTTQSVEEILRPLAEARVERVKWEEFTPGTLHSVGIEEVPDPRFEALRCNHPRAYGHSEDGHTCCPDCGYESMENEGGIDASLGAIVRAAAACGNVVLRTVLSAVEDALRIGAAPEGAAARALVQALVGLGQPQREH